MKLIVGLGNPGEEYKNNRHNVGFMFVNYLFEQDQKSKIPSTPSAKLRINPLRTSKNQNYNPKFKSDKYLLSNVYHLSPNLVLAKPQTFMNQSGVAIGKLIKNYKLEIKNLVVVHDDLDIPLGKFHIQKGVGPKLHNGIESIEKTLGTKDFLRVRIGVDNRLPEKRIDGETYVLQNFINNETVVINQVFSEIFPWIKKLIQ